MKANLLFSTTCYLLVALAVPAAAQSPVSGITPSRNAVAAARATTLTATTAQAPAAGTTLRVFSQQAGGRKAGTTTITGNTVTFDPATDFRAGETVAATLASPGAPGHIWQFTAMASGGTGTFGGGSDFNTFNPNTTLGLRPGDFDGDGDLDALLVQQLDGPRLLLNDGTGRLAAGNANLPYTNNPSQVATGDVDGDGDLDVVASASRPYFIEIARNNGTATFSASTIPNNPLSMGVAGLTLADLDGDADLDLCYFDFVAGRLTWLPNDGTGTFGGARTTTGTVSNVSNLRIGDIDNDGDLDALAFSNTGTGTVQFFLNSGGGTFTAGPTLVVSSYNGQMTLLDVDGDGDLDLATDDYGLLPQVHLYLNSGSGAFTAGAVVPTGSTFQNMVFGDVDGDGDQDLMTSGYGTISLRLNTGSGTFVAGPNALAGACLALADLDGDNDLDLLSALPALTGHWVVSSRLNGGALATRPAAPATLFTVWPNPVSAATATLRVQLPAATTAGLSLSNALGQVIHEKSFRGAGTELPVTRLAAGLYLLRVQVPGHAPATHRVIVE